MIATITAITLWLLGAIMFYFILKEDDKYKPVWIIAASIFWPLFVIGGLLWSLWEVIVSFAHKKLRVKDIWFVMYGYKSGKWEGTKEEKLERIKCVKTFDWIQKRCQRLIEEERI